MIYQEHCLIIQEMIFFLQEASSSSATTADSSLFPIASSGDTTKHSGEDVTADSERPGTSGATVTTTEGLVCTCIAQGAKAIESHHSTNEGDILLNEEEVLQKGNNGRKGG